MLGNGNLGVATMKTRSTEMLGRTVCRLERITGGGETGRNRGDHVGLEVITCNGNKGGKADQNHRGIVEDRVELGAVATVLTRHLEQQI